MRHFTEASLTTAERHLGAPRRIFEILIYRCTEKQYWAEQESDCAKFLKLMGVSPSSSASYVIGLEQSWFERYGGSWINEAVGLITLKAAPGRIGGWLYLVQYRRIQKRMLHKRIYAQGRIFEFGTYPQDDNSAIFKRLREELELGIASQPSLKNRVVDFEPLNTLGPYIDWVAVTA